MRRVLIFLTLVGFLLLACQAVSYPLSHLPLPGQVVPTSSATPTPLPTSTPSPMPTATLVATEQPAAPGNLAPLPDITFDVRFHPDGDLYVGDQVSLEIVAPSDVNLEGRKVQVEVDGSQSQVLGPAEFGPYGIAGRYQATLLWAWNTSGLQSGPHILTFSILPNGPSWTQTVVLQPASAVPLSQQEAHWAEARGQYCILYYITGTAAERDITELLKMADEQAQDASQRLQTDFVKPIPIVLMPRVLGQGGFTTEDIYISYLDRNYAGGSPAMVLHHEMIHILDAHLGGDLRPTLLIEGLAVYLTGGHFKPEALIPRAAAALDLGMYIPLATLADNFYPSQHEIGYLEASSLIEFMVNTWGWDSFSSFYRDIHPDPSDSQAQAINSALQAHYGFTFSELEQRYLQVLHAQKVTPDMEDDVSLTVNYYDTVRRYQQALDPSAYFMTAWLPDAGQMRQKGIVADLLRHPDAPENIALETLLVSANSSLLDGDYSQTKQILEAANLVLDAIAQDGGDPFDVNHLAADYYAIVTALLTQGYQAQRIQVNGNRAQAWVTTTGPELTEIYLLRAKNEWRIEPEAQTGIFAGSLLKPEGWVEVPVAARAWLLCAYSLPAPAGDKCLLQQHTR